jgi:hypothetical protein
MALDQVGVIVIVYPVPRAVVDRKYNSYPAVPEEVLFIDPKQL